MTAHDAAGSKADRPLATITTLEPQGERRRRQLVEIASRVIEQEGADAVRIPRVAELAGVGRTAIYRYFPRREDLLEAVSEEFDARLRKRITAEQFAEALLALRNATDGAMPASTALLFEAIWDVLDECGPAGLILGGQLSSRSREEGEPELVGRFRAQWVALGLPDLEAMLVSDLANTILTRTYFSARRGEISRQDAIGLGYRALLHLFRGLSAPSPR
jgi:AcrR family transcriptional regulator